MIKLDLIFNDTKFGKYSLTGNNYYSYFKYFNLFQFLYLDELTDPSLLAENGIDVDDLIEEYEIIENKIFDEMLNFIEDEFNVNFAIDIKKTTCKSDLYYNGKKCMKDNFLLIVYKINSNFNLINEFYIDQPNRTLMQTIFFSMSIISNNYDYLKWKINQILIYKIIRLFFFLFISSMCFVFFYFIVVKIFFEVKFDLLNQILYKIKGGSLFELKNISSIKKSKEEIKIESNNKEMTQIKNLFDYLIKSLLLKIKFEQNEYNSNNEASNFSESEKRVENQNIKIKDITNRNGIINKNDIDTLNEYKDLIDNINNNEIHIMFAFILSFDHFKKGYYKLSEHEFKDLINDINKYQNTMLNNNENNESKLKDTISRCSKISYLNEYSLTNELNEMTLPIIKIKLLAQKIYYLYAFCIFTQEKIKSKNDKKYQKEKNIKRYEEAIKYFTECKNISISLGIDIIRQIFSLIMISKCFNELENYKDSMININEALLLFSDLQNTFKDKPYFNPKIMIFVENYIFQSIMLSMAQTTFNFNKYPQSCWILMKMIETSLFVFNNIHFKVYSLLKNCINQIDIIYKLPLRQTDKYKNKINKMFIRINLKLYNNESYCNNNSINNITMNNMISIPSKTNTQIYKLNSSTDYLSNIYTSKKFYKTKDIISRKFSFSVNSLNNYIKNQYKNITLCISEKLLQDINGRELKYFLINCYKKFFMNNTEDNKFNFIQFSSNGKKTISIKTKTLEDFLQKLEFNKLAFKVHDTYTNNNIQIQFMEFSNLLMDIIKSNKQENFEDKCDNIIIIFINTADIRFNSEKECVETINELNHNNYSIIIFTYDIEIEKEKIKGIYSFLYGLNDAHFFQVKNYQQIKQIFMNFSLKIFQEKFINYNYEITEFML